MRARLALGLLCAVAWLAPVRPLPAQRMAAAPVARTGDAYVVTMGQGDAIWEQFGHNFLAVPDAATGRMIAYNWGIFDFASPDFLSRFLLGDTRYWMEGADLDAVIAFYRRYDRSITLQRLALAPAQLDSLRAFLAWNAQPENRYYRYDYFRDNCSTRLRDALDRGLGGQLRAATEHRLTNLTYRSESVRLTDAAPASQAGIAVALGQPADAPLSEWEAMFVPMRLQEYLRAVRVRDASGALVPLVTEEQVVFEAQRPPERERAPDFLAVFAIPGLLLAAALVLLGRGAARGGATARRLLGAVGAAWGAVAGIIGTVLLLAWAATRHLYWYRNENLFHFSPLALALVVLLPLALARPRWWRTARLVAYGVAVLSAVGAVLKFMPWMMQDNWGPVLLALPANLALAWAVGRVSAPDALGAGGAPPPLRRARRLGGRARDA